MPATSFRNSPASVSRSFAEAAVPTCPDGTHYDPVWRRCVCDDPKRVYNAKLDACVCGPGLTDCGGTCANLRDDEANCGACGVTCAPDQYCAKGSCRPRCAIPGQVYCPATDDCRASFAELKGRGVEFTEEPFETPYGIDSGFRDPSGNSIRLTQVNPDFG